jgi:hypothetical protein
MTQDEAAAVIDADFVAPMAGIEPAASDGDNRQASGAQIKHPGLLFAALAGSVHAYPHDFSCELIERGASWRPGAVGRPAQGR